MKTIDLMQVRRNVTVLAFLFAGTAASIVLATGAHSPAALFFLVAGFVCMAVHWWQLVAFVSAFFCMARFETLLRVMLLTLPVGFALAVVFVAGHIGSDMLLFAVLGVVSVPVAGSVYVFLRGLHGCLNSVRNKGFVHE